MWLYYTYHLVDFLSFEIIINYREVAKLVEFRVSFTKLLPMVTFYINVVKYQKQETDIYAILLTTFCLVQNSQGFKSTHTHTTHTTQHTCVCFHAI